MLVSIVTPSYNQAQFVEDTLRSVLAQDYPHIEYIVIDGASSDGSPDIIARYASRLAYWTSEPDQGQAEAINKGFQRARGDIVAWLNSDDVYLPGAVSRAVQAFAAHPQAGFVFGDALTIDAQGHPLSMLRFGEWGLDELLRFRIICQPAVFMRRAVLQQSGGLDQSYHFMLDHNLWLRLARLAPPQYIGSGDFNPLALARHHAAAKNLTMTRRAAEEIERLLGWMQTQPDLQSKMQNRQIQGGAYRLAARYLLEGDLPGPALRMYFKALRAWPAYTLQHARRMAYAALMLPGPRRFLAQRRQEDAQRRSRVLAAILRNSPLAQTWKDWPGICLD
jgi:glycosyltransferase involved in cell wall biosynthesis